MKKRTIIAFILICTIVLSACAGAKLSDIYKEDEVIAKAKETVEVINTLDYDSMMKVLREDLRDQLDSNTLKDAWDAKLSAAGEFKEYQSVTTLGQKSKTTGEDYAVVVLTCTYENDTLIYTLSMDSNLEIVGMYMK